MLCNIIIGQTAQNVLDKIAATISNKSGISANFKITNGQQMNFSGTISVKGKSFMPQQLKPTFGLTGRRNGHI